MDLRHLISVYMVDSISCNNLCWCQLTVCFMSLSYLYSHRIDISSDHEIENNIGSPEHYEVCFGWNYNVNSVHFDEGKGWREDSGQKVVVQ